MFISLYGPPGAGKTSLGRRLAQALGRPFTDLDEAIVARAGCSIAEIFAREGEPAFRALEKRLLRETLSGPPQVVALGGGALLDPENRAAAEAGGPVLCLSAPLETLYDRLQVHELERPLLREPQSAAHTRERLQALLEARAAHYASFPLQFDTSAGGPNELLWRVQVRLGVFHLKSMATAFNPAYDVVVRSGGLAGIGQALRELGFNGGRAAVVGDGNVMPLYAPLAGVALHKAGFTAYPVVLPAGEATKTLETASALWHMFLDQVELDRSTPVLALGGGVIGDLTGFAASVYLRGVPWVNLPTTLLAMVDASLGGKTGVDMPQAKNLVGSFFPPRLVLADPETLATLPEAELRSGLAEVVKHGILGDPELFALCGRGWDYVTAHLDEIVRRAVAVKVRVVAKDPYERGLRAALNLGHTAGHALEQASDYSLRHGEAVAIGMVIEARLAEARGLAPAGLADEIAAVLAGLGLPTRVPPGLGQALSQARGVDWERLRAIMGYDKKRKAGVVHFALPVGIGEVKVGVPVADLDELRPFFK